MQEPDEEFTKADVYTLIILFVILLIAGAYAKAAHQPILDIPMPPGVYWDPHIGDYHAQPSLPDDKAQR